MIETLVVLLIVLILAGMVVPALTAGRRSSKLRDAATRTATAFRRARSMAIAAGEVYGVHMDKVTDLAELRDRQASVRIHPTSGAGSLALDASASAGGIMLPKGVNFGTGTGELTQIFFLPDGSAAILSPATWRPVKLFYYRPDASIPEPGRYEVTVRPLTGRIETKLRN